MPESLTQKPPLEHTLEEHINGMCGRANLRLMTFAIVCFLGFGLLDAFVHPELLSFFLELRVAAALVIGGLWFWQWRNQSAVTNVCAVSLAFVVIGATISLMVYHTGGGSSHYYAGLSLTCVAVGAVAVWTLPQTIASMAILVGTFVLVSFIHPTPLNTPMFVSNMAFLLSSALIGIISIEWRMRAATTAYQVRAQLAESADLMARMAARDPLTGLLNRRVLEHRVQGSLINHRRYGEVSSLAAIDLDHFKQVNDHLGHQAGDDLIIKIGKCLQRLVRPDDLVFRLGGDEFLILLRNTDLDAAQDTVKRIHEALQAEFRKAPFADFNLDSSIGLLSVGYEAGECENARHLIQKVDRLLYKAKNTGRGRIVSALAA